MHLQAAVTLSYLDIDAFVCLADAGNGGRRCLAGIRCGTGIVWWIQKALLRPCHIRQAAQKIGPSAPSHSHSCQVSVSVCLSPHQAKAKPQTHLRAVERSGHVALLANAWVCVGKTCTGRVIHRNGGLLITVRKDCWWMLWREEENRSINNDVIQLWILCYFCCQDTANNTSLFVSLFLP